MLQAPDLPVTVAGADGCPGGWVLVTANVAVRGLALQDVRVVSDFAALLEVTADRAAVAVDIPIGLAEDGRRQADALAKQLLARRHVCVFYAPPRALLGATSHAAATALNRSLFGCGITQQTYNILRKIEEADAVLEPCMQARVLEAHPEVSFAELNNGAAVPWKKKSSEGRAERLRLLQTIYGPPIRDLTPPRGATWDDLYDACVLAVTASHVAAGTAVHLPREPQRDARGLRMEIVY